MNKLFILLFVWCGVLNAITAQYNIKSLGMNFASLSLCIDEVQQTINVQAHSVQTGDIIAKLDNSYHITFDKSFQPLVYQRQIRQKKLETEVITRYDHASGKASLDDSAKTMQTQFQYPPGTRDIFTFLAYCAQDNAKAGNYPIDANGVIWQAKLSTGTKEQIKTSLGKFDTTKYLLEFKQIGSGKAPYIDMVTFNLVNAATKLELWISDNGIPLKARVKKGSQTMKWELVALKP